MISTQHRHVVVTLIALMALTLQGEQVVARGNPLSVSPKIADGASNLGSKTFASRSTQVDKRARYLIYISGYIVHAGNLRPSSPRFGIYEYEKILETFRQNGFIVISEARKQSSELEPYATTVARQIDQLLQKGVLPQQITVVGASQGAWIVMVASTSLKNRNLNFVLLGSCAADDGLLNIVDLHGNFLFISERTDLPGSCERFRTDATGLSEYKFLEINTGQKHGFLFRPLEEWIVPTIDWAQRKSSTKK